MANINNSTEFKTKVMTTAFCLVIAFGLGACQKTKTSVEQSAPKLERQATSQSEIRAANYDFSSTWLHINRRGLQSDTAPNLVLIPGLVSSSEVWDGVITELGKTHRLHVVDVSGFAGLPALGDTEIGVVTGMVSDLAGYIGTNNLKNVTLMGHSLGGFTSLVIARDHGALIDKVITVDSLPFYPVIFNPAATVETATPQAESMGNMILALDEEGFESMQKRTVSRMSKNKAAQAQILSWSLNSDRATMVQAMRDLMTSDLRPDLQSIETDIHVIYAWDAAMGMPADSMGKLYEKQYDGLKNVNLTRIDNSYHFIMNDQPQKLLAAVQTALNTR